VVKLPKIRRPRREKKTLIEVIILCDGANHHEIISNPKKIYRWRGVSYRIDSKHFFRLQRGIFRRLVDKVKGIKARYQIFFRECIPEALDFHNAVKWSEDRPLITSKLLSITERSQALTKALKEFGARYINPRQLLFIFIILAVGVVAYFILTGQIDLSELMKGGV